VWTGRKGLPPSLAANGAIAHCSGGGSFILSARPRCFEPAGDLAILCLTLLKALYMVAVATSAQAETSSPKTLAGRCDCGFPWTVAKPGSKFLSFPTCVVCGHACDPGRCDLSEREERLARAKEWDFAHGRGHLHK